MCPTTREQFLLEFYNNVWLNVRRAETSLWILFPFYFTAIVGLFIYRIQLGTLITSVLLLIISVFVSYISFNLNLWFVRNMRLVSRAEKEFLNQKDFNKIIPKRWVERSIKFFNTEPYCLLGITYILVGIILTIFLLFFITDNPLTIDHLLLLFFLWVLILIVESFFVNKLRLRYNRNLSETI